MEELELKHSMEISEIRMKYAANSVAVSMLAMMLLLLYGLQARGALQGTGE